MLYYCRLSKLRKIKIEVARNIDALTQNLPKFTLFFIFNGTESQSIGMQMKNTCLKQFPVERFGELGFTYLREFRWYFHAFYIFLEDAASVPSLSFSRSTLIQKASSSFVFNDYKTTADII